MSLPAVVLPDLYAQRIAASGKNSGTLDVKWDDAEQLAVIDGFRAGREGIRRQGLSEVPGRHHLAYATTNAEMGLWFRVEPALHLVGSEAARRGAVTRLDAFRGHVVGGDWINPGKGSSTLAVTVASIPEVDEPHFVAWRLIPDIGAAEMIPLEVVEEMLDLFAPLADAWPLEKLASKTLAVIGTGSIGSAATEALSAYGIRRLVLVDPDRLSADNFARLRLDPANVGRYKVNALAQHLRERDPSIEIEPLTLDVIYDADLIRPVLREIDGAVIATDGVESRRAANHLLRRARKPSVFACVLSNGAFGEILRIRPPATGCLLCARAALVAEGAMNPEPSIDRGYGTGTRHLPMTAVGGDLALTGDLAAKAIVATMLEDLGYRDQRLPGDHAVLGLQPQPDVTPPFDVEFAGKLRWRRLPPPRADCPTCGRA